MGHPEKSRTLKNGNCSPKVFIQLGLVQLVWICPPPPARNSYIQLLRVFNLQLTFK